MHNLNWLLGGKEESEETTSNEKLQNYRQKQFESALGIKEK